MLPYAKDLQPRLTSELERAVYLQMSEQDFKVPGWMLSTGTLRILCLLALFRHPNPPPLIIIEEIENGLDPRTMHLIVEEIRNLRRKWTLAGHCNDTLAILARLVRPLADCMLVERREGTGRCFSLAPDDQPELERWARTLWTRQLVHDGNCAR